VAAAGVDDSLEQAAEAPRAGGAVTIVREVSQAELEQRAAAVELTDCSTACHFELPSVCVHADSEDAKAVLRRNQRCAERRWGLGPPLKMRILCMAAKCPILRAK
jgi:hypothetical protein